MANNPFYPGYAPGKPKEDSVNPIYPGYYAGQPLQRKPASKNFIKPIEYDVDAYMQNIDDAARKVLLAPFAGPRWFLQRVVDDWKENLKVSIKPKEIKVTEMDDYSTEDFPGAVVTLSLNPADWKKDPKKQALKTAQKWFKQATGVDLGDLSGSDFSEIENKTNRKLWLDTYLTPDETAGYYGERASEAIAGRLKAEAGDLITPRDNAMSLNDSDIRISGVNYKPAVQAIGGFVEQRSNPLLREKNRNNYIVESAKAIGDEINIRIKDPRYSTFSNKYEGAIGMFNIRNKILENIGEAGGLQKGIKNSTEKLEKSILGQKDKETGRTIMPSAAWAELDIALRKSNKNIKSELNNARDLFNRGKIDEDSYRKLTNIVGDIEKFSNGVKEVLDSVNTSSTASIKEQEAAKKKLERATNGGLTGKTLTSGGTFRPSIEGKIAGDQNAAIVNPTLGGVGALIADDDARASGLDLHARKLVPALNRLNADRVRFATKEVLNAWDQEKIMELYAWNRLKKVLPSWTGGKFIEDRLKKSNYYGLKITDEGIPWTDPEKLAKFQKKYGYKVKMKLDSEKYGVSKIVLIGGDHFKILKNDLFKKFDLSKDFDKDLLKSIFDGTYNKNALARKLFGCSYDEAMKKGLGKKYDTFLKESKKYKEWFKAQKKTFGKNKLKDPALAISLLGEIKQKNDKLNDGYKLFDRKYIGRLEKIHNKVLSLQKWWETHLPGKFLKFLQEWKTIVSEGVGELLAKVISKLFGAAAAASGVGAVLTAVVEFAVKKALEYSEAWIKACIKWDFEDFSKMVNKDLTKLVKSCAIVFAIFVLLVIGPSWLLFGIIGSSISPIDPTIGNSGFGIGAAPGENEVVKVRKSSRITVYNSDGSTTTLENPTQITNEQAAGAIVEYTINITPRISIYDGSVSYADTAMIMASSGNNNSRRLLNTPYESLTEFIEGKGIKILLKTVHLSALDKDTFLRNTVAVDTPAVPTEGIEPDSVSYSIFTRIGNYVSECPLGLTDYHVLTTSFNGSYGHGSQSYWEGICRNDPDPPSCYNKWPIPVTWEGGKPKHIGDKYYGYAMDVAAGDNKEDHPVTLPSMGGKNITWNVTKIILSNDPGYNGFVAVSTDGKWQISYIHMDEGDLGQMQDTYKPGEIVGKMSPHTPGNKHVHVELIDTSGGGHGIPVRPEDYLCL